jgi:peptidoglycan hydrolase-like protein with peptidoglycan-binding domain
MTVEPENASGQSRWRRRRRLRALLVGGTVAVTVVVAAIAALGLGGQRDDPASSARSAPGATAVVSRQSLVETVTLTGRLTYGVPLPIASAVAGTVTWLPASGALVKRGEALLRADDEPVVLLYGGIPMFRILAVGTEGPDVEQFERNLSSLGYAGFTVDDTFSKSTSDAVKSWQKDLELPQSGSVERGRVVYGPGAMRIAKQLVRLGESATGDVLSYTGTTRVVTVAAEAAEIAWAKKGEKVNVALPNGSTVTGRVSGVTIPDLDEAPPAAEGEGPATATTSSLITIAIADQKALGDLNAAAVEVRYVAKERKDVLTVPVSSLLALAEGGYGLEVLADGTSRIVPIKAGMFANGLVEVSGPGIAAGTVVGAPQ